MLRNAGLEVMDSNRISHVGFFSRHRLLTGTVGRLEPHSRALSTSLMRSEGVATIARPATLQFPNLTPE